MRTFLLAVSALLALLPTGLRRRRATGSSPTSFFILADDLGYSDLGCYGSEFDAESRPASPGRLALHAILQHRALLASRAALLTGYYAR